MDQLQRTSRHSVAADVSRRHLPYFRSHHFILTFVPARTYVPRLRTRIGGDQLAIITFTTRSRYASFKASASAACRNRNRCVTNPFKSITPAPHNPTARG
jgi:hypothetical protein